MAEPQSSPRITVAVAKATAYDATALATVEELLDSLDLPLAPGDRVLVKPNLLRAEMLACTNATIVAGVCRYVLDKGCRLTLGDSPGFGTAKGVAETVGLHAALARVGCKSVSVIPLDSPVARPLSLGGSISLSRHALEADHILNVPKLKAHVQMRVTGAVKNLFGCICGLRKAFAHSRYGDKEQDGVQVFPSLVADILTHLPPVATLMDAVAAMHVRGPSGGKEYPSHFLAASLSPVALDTAVYSLLRVSPEQVPLWSELQRRNAAGAFFEDIEVCGNGLDGLDFSNFVLPETLSPQTFNPARLMVSTLKRVWAKMR